MNVLTIHLPPLRARREDIPTLTQALVLKMRQRGVWPQGLRLSSGAIDLLCGQPWPGNVRELENVLERIAASSADASVVAERDVREALTVTIRPLNLSAPAHPLAWHEGEGLDEFLDRQQLELFEHMLTLTRGNVAAAARRLKIHRTTLHHHMKRVRQRVTERTSTQSFHD